MNFQNQKQNDLDRTSVRRFYFEMTTNIKVVAIPITAGETTIPITLYALECAPLPNKLLIKRKHNIVPLMQIGIGLGSNPPWYKCLMTGIYWAARIRIHRNGYGISSLN